MALKRFKRLLKFLLIALAVNYTSLFLEPTYTYIRDINLPYPVKHKIVYFLNKNDPAVNGMFSRQSLRPITISLGKLSEEKLAESQMYPFSCKITMNDSYDWNKVDILTLNTTILHELGHCFGFWTHDPDPSSIMYWVNTPTINQDSIDKFLVRLNKKGHF